MNEMLVEDLSESEEERITREWALEASDWRSLANHAGVHPADMARFLKGEASLTAPNRAAIRKALR